MSTQLISEGPARDVRALVGGFLIRHWPRILAATAALIATFVAVYYAGQPLLEHEAWRQTQTALTSYWMVQEGWRLAYETPVLGYPWAIPLEFPIYQSIVALIAWIGGFPLDPVGRLVSFGFLLACGWPAFQIAKRLGLPRETAWLFCALLWTSPLYLFYGRNFLIETAAVFLAFAAIPYALDLRSDHPRWTSVSLFALVASLAMLQKMSTAFPVIVALAVVLAIHQIGQHGWVFPRWRKLGLVAVAFTIPALVSLGWLLYTDVVKAANPMMGSIHSNEAMTRIWFGAHHLLLDPQVVKVMIWDRILAYNAGAFLGVVLLSAAMIWGSATERRTVVAGTAFCLATVFVFINHHYFLDYYQVAAVIYVIGALAVAVTCGLRGIARRAGIVPLVASVLMIANVFYFFTGYGHHVRQHIDATNSATLAVSDVISRATPPGSAIVVAGVVSTASIVPVMGWSSEVAYYSGRKALTLREWRESEAMYWDDPAAYLGDHPLGAMTICHRGNLEPFLAAVMRYGSGRETLLHDVGGCLLWLPTTERVTLPNGETAGQVSAAELLEQIPS